MPSENTSRARRLTWVVPILTALTLAVVPLKGDEVNRIVLRVNDEILTLYDYEKRKEADVTAILANPELSSRDRQELLGQVAPRIMQDMFRELLLMSRAKQLRVFVSDEEIDASVQDLARSRGIPNEAAFQQALEASGMTMDQLRDKMRREMTWSQVVSREVTSAIEVGEEELRAYYRNNEEQFKIPEKRWLKEVIVLESSGKSTEELGELAGEIREKLRAGGEFDTVIEPYRSAGQTTGVIDLDWLRSDELDSTLSEVAFQLLPGAYSEPVASRGGLHIIHLAGLEEAQLRPFEEVQAQILNRERSLLFDQELRRYLGELERTAFVNESLPAEAVGYRSLAADYVPEQEIQLFQQPELPAEPPVASESETSE